MAKSIRVECTKKALCKKEQQLPPKISFAVSLEIILNEKVSSISCPFEK